MKERPILFNDEMVRALLDGRKTQTRRLLKPQPEPTPADYQGAPGHWWLCDLVQSMVHVEEQLQDKDGPWAGFAGSACPFGEPGDRLWVREAFACLGNEDGVCIDWDGNLQKGDEREAARIYRASCERAEYGLWRIPDKAFWKPDTDGHHFDGAWRPSIHMPRWACRLLLEVTAVRVERLRDITETDAIAEGCDNSGTEAAQECGWYEKPRRAFRRVWEQINGADSWDANPWVWVVEFRRIDQHQEAT